MRQILIGLVLLTLIGCGQSEFCGHSVDESEFSNLKGKVEGNGLSVGMQLSFATTKELGDNTGINFEIDYSVQDTLVINVINLPDEKSAKKLSCIVFDNETIQKTKVVYTRYIIGDKIKTFKY